MDRGTRLRTYAQVWRLERVIYQIEGVSLPVAVTVQQVAVFFGGAAGMGLLSRLIPGLVRMSPILRYILLPALASWYLTRQRLDGKPPHRWLWCMLAFWAGPKRLNRLQPMGAGGRKQVRLLAGFDRGAGKAAD